jgi:hypothetical protein
VVAELDFDELLRELNCWPSEPEFKRFLELLREALMQSPNATCFYGMAGAENGLLVDVFETIQQTQSKEFPQVEDDFENDDFAKNVTRYFCLPFLQSFFDVAQSTGEWAPLIADFTLYTKSLTQDTNVLKLGDATTARYRAKRWTTNSTETSENSSVSIYARRHLPDGLVVDRTFAKLNWVTARHAMLAFELKRSIEEPGLLRDARHKLARDCLNASRDGALLSVETPVLIGVVGDGANWRFELLHVLMSSASSANDHASDVVYADVVHTFKPQVAIQESSNYHLGINEIKDFLNTGRASERIKSFCRAMLGALWLSGKRLRVNTFAQKIGERIGESLPTALSVLVVRGVATFHITSYLNVTDRSAVVKATMQLWPTNQAAATTDAAPLSVAPHDASRDSTTAAASASTANTSRPPPKLPQIIEQLKSKGVDSPVSNRTRSRKPAAPPVSATPAIALPTAAPPTAPPVSSPATPTLPPTPTAPPAAPSMAPSISPQHVVLKLMGENDDVTAIKRELKMRSVLATWNKGVLIDGIVPIMALPMPSDVPFIVMEHYGVDLAQVDLTDDVTRNAVVRAFPAFESMLKLIHDAGYVVFDLWPRNILVQRNGSVVKLWLIDLESMLREGEPCVDTPQLRLDDLNPQTAHIGDDWVRWDRVKLFVERKGLVPFALVNKAASATNSTN